MAGAFTIDAGRAPLLWSGKSTKAEACIKEINGELARFVDPLKGNVQRVRQALKKLLVDRVTFTPIESENGKQIYAFTGELSYGALVREGHRIFAW